MTPQKEPESLVGDGTAATGLSAPRLASYFPFSWKSSLIPEWVLGHVVPGFSKL
jgi:hypothetical protein